MNDASVVGVDELESKGLAASFGVPVPRGVRVSQVEEVSRAVAGLQPPFVVKLLSRTPIHKSDVGGVKVGLNSSADVVAAIQQMTDEPRIPSGIVSGYLIEEMAASGQELIVGAKVDPSFGPMIMVGAGGIYVHVLDDVAVRVCPVTAADALEMLQELRIAPMIFGARGQDPVDVGGLVDAIVRIGGENGLIMTHQSEISELDINPLIVGRDGACAVDVRVVPTDGGAL
ncbi:acetyl-CoA synthetase [Microbacterium faecale]|uniref:Acetyl-CoA synthetase n=1 Tax=Microbacterium faecale TaxID=1804630 RepID=A0A917DF34_9MICO|nr:acetate--CoA ligase family protein [Microbacterium faecale]GGD31641.1 acetyl-CoA synthetase [Microbacterium faecale]